jgi:hypothetical protein
MPLTNIPKVRKISADFHDLCREMKFTSHLRDNFFCSVIRKLPLVIFLFIATFVSAQDSIPYTAGFKFTDGLYTDFESFRHNKPILKSAIVSGFDHNEIDFLRKIVATKSITYKDNAGMEREINPSGLWGFCENNSVYIHYNGDFNKIVVMGSICHFTAMYTTYLSTGPGVGGTVGAGAPVESVQQYVLDMQTGKVLDFILPNMEELYKRDDALYKEFMAMKKNKRRKLMFFYLRKYNERHTVYFYS